MCFYFDQIWSVLGSILVSRVFFIFIFVFDLFFLSFCIFGKFNLVFSFGFVVGLFSGQTRATVPQKKLVMNEKSISKKL